MLLVIENDDTFKYDNFVESMGTCQDNLINVIKKGYV